MFYYFLYFQYYQNQKMYKQRSFSICPVKISLFSDDKRGFFMKTLFCFVFRFKQNLDKFIFVKRGIVIFKRESTTGACITREPAFPNGT